MAQRRLRRHQTRSSAYQAVFHPTRAGAGPGKNSGVNGVDGQETADWGKSIRTSSDGKTSLFERDLGNGHKVFTFVIWAN